MKKIIIILLLACSTVPAQFQSSSSRFLLKRQVISSAGVVRTSAHYRVAEYIGVQNFGRMKNLNYLLGPSAEVQLHALHEMPKDFVLQRNYPNPFNAETIIEYSVPNTCQVQLTVFSLLGQKVCTLVEAVHVPGSYSAHFDGRDSFNRPLPSGLYVVRMQTTAFSATILVSLLR